MKMSVALSLPPSKSKTGSEMSNRAVEVGRLRVVVLVEEMVVLVVEGVKGRGDGSESDVVFQVSISLCGQKT